MSWGNLCKNQGRGKGGFIENLNLETIEEVYLLDKFLYNLHWCLLWAIGGKHFVLSCPITWRLHVWKENCGCCTEYLSALSGCDVLAPPVFATCSSLDGVPSRVCGRARCQILWRLSLPRLVVLRCPVEQKWGCCPACKRQAVISAGRIKAFVMWTTVL